MRRRAEHLAEFYQKQPKSHAVVRIFEPFFPMNLASERAWGQKIDAIVVKLSRTFLVRTKIDCWFVTVQGVVIR